MTKKKVTFIVTKYKKRNARVDFYDKTGKKINPQQVKSETQNGKIEFYTYGQYAY